ncbi:MAG: hypothetical protein DRJ52_01710 [Thermoprotei archaeon]|nr:MAG: hypothetical protein DRJ52_01710 [Thermoprotei archaeon]
MQSYEIFIVVSSSIIALLLLASVTLNTLIVDYNKINYLTRKIIEWERSKEKAIKKKNRKLYNKLMRQRTHINNIKTEIEKEKIKGYILSFIVWIISFKFLSDIFLDIDIVYVPFINNTINIAYYFVLISIWLYPILIYIVQRKLMKINIYSI